MDIVACGSRPSRKVGPSSFTCPVDATDYDESFDVADKRLYEAKSTGRNRVVGAESLAEDLPDAMAQAG